MRCRQLFEKTSSTYTYLLWTDQGVATLIDPVVECVERDLRLIEELGLRLGWTLETHVHADHITGSGLLRQRVGSQALVFAGNDVPCVDRFVQDGESLDLNGVVLQVLATPGHTSGCASYHSPELGAVFTGDALLIRGCGRTDFQQGNARTLFESVTRKLFHLPDETIVFPGHDYRGFTQSTIGEEKRVNPRFAGKSMAEFVALMANLDLALPARIHEALPANQNCGISPNTY